MDQHRSNGLPRTLGDHPSGDGTQEEAAREGVVALGVAFEAGDARAVLAGELVFDRRDPYAVAMHLQARTGQVTWTFARELLAEGLYRPCGDGDVHVWPCLSSTAEAVVVIELTSPDGTAMLQVSSRAVQGFVQRAHDLVPEGHESDHLALDDLLARLLGS